MIWTRAIEVNDHSQVAEARRTTLSLATAAGLGGDRASDAAIVATELCTNLVKHGGGGTLLVQPGRGLDLIALDKGRGIPDLDRAMRDGFSTAGSPGNGLGAIRRLSNSAEVYTQPEKGTVIVASVWPEPRRGPAEAAWQPDGVVIAVICTALRGEPISGDGFATDQGQDCFTFLIADGLGHGPTAAEASDAALQAFERHKSQPLPVLVASIHGALRASRGAAVAVARLHRDLGVVKYCGVGNIVGAVVADDAVRRMVSHNGTAGMGTPRAAEFSYPWSGGNALIMHSDGIGTKWDLAAYPGLARRHPALIAGVIYRDFARGRDDATVVVAREASA